MKWKGINKMATTVKRITISLTKENLRVLEELKKHFGENISQVIHRACSRLHWTTLPRNIDIPMP